MAQQASTSEIRGGFKIIVEGQPYIVVSNEFVKPGKGQAFNRMKLKHLMTGRVIERTFKSGDKFDLADVQEIEMRQLYQENDGVVFMDEKTFEQITIPFEKCTRYRSWLMDDHLYMVIFYNGEPVNVEPPTFMEMVVKRRLRELAGIPPLEEY